MRTVNEEESRPLTEDIEDIEAPYYRGCRGYISKGLTEDIEDIEGFHHLDAKHQSTSPRSIPTKEEQQLPDTLEDCQLEVVRLRKHISSLGPRERSGSIDILHDPTRRSRLEYTIHDETLETFWHRALWLVGLLVLQSTSSFILEAFGTMVIIYLLLYIHYFILYYIYVII
eukprot:GHVR01174336.1.p1 GENE.GHVR01174336.1~~GHVR01174336.1.p1  ORF type:complete len:171 (+),score=22.91 GHVR01174336.1:56-568(+)